MPIVEPIGGHRNCGTGTTGREVAGSSQLPFGACWWVFLACLVPLVAEPVPEAHGPVVTLRVRATAIEPKAYVRLLYPVGKSWGEITRVRPQAPGVGAETPDLLKAEDEGAEDTPEIAEDKEGDSGILIQEGDTYNYLWLAKGTWSPAVPVSTFGGWTLFEAQGLDARDRKTLVPVTSVTLEFELRYVGKVIKRLTGSATDWNRVMIFLPVHLLKGPDGGTKPPGPDFLAGTYGLLEYATRRAEKLENLPWAAGPVPRRYGILSTCSGWKVQSADPEVYLAEYRSLRQMGVNGIYYGTWPGLEEHMRQGTDLGRQFRRICGNHLGHVCRSGGYLVPKFIHGNIDAAAVAAGVGCPHHPAHAGLRERVRADVEELMARLRSSPIEEYWLKTVDEIGSYFDGSAERKAHQGCCPYCRKAFHDYLRGFGLKPEDFGAKGLDEVRSVYGYWAKPWVAPPENDEGRPQTKDEGPELGLNEAQVDPEKLALEAPDEMDTEAGKDTPAGPRPGTGADETKRTPPLPAPGWARLHYYSRRFNNDASARIFSPVREAFIEQNEAKRKALAEGRLDAAEAKQPWVYAYALRGNTFLMGGHSLDFFDFYRYADNGFAYETSNRDPRVWQWDSYLCDVGRILQDKLGTRFSIMVKPGRGAPIQRVLTAVARQARVIDLYTYGPDWHHPDTFARAPNRLVKLSRVAHLLGAAEEVTYEAQWASPAEIAVVRPRTSEINENGASHENGKWVYEALAHAHLPIDPLDEEFLLSEDLTRYKIIFLSGSHIRKDVAARLADWVREGGIVYTSGWGLARDEADRPLSVLLPVLGLKSREAPDLWSSVRRYGATALRDYERLKDPPEGAAVAGRGLFQGRFDLAVGREVLDPVPEAEVLATFADGQPAAIRHRWGKGTAYVVGFYPGSEYAADVLRPDFDLSVHFRPEKRAFISSVALAAGVEPAVDASHPLIEGVMLKNPQTNRLAVVLMNWAFRGRDLVPLDDVQVKLRGTGQVEQIHSTWKRQPLPFDQEGDSVTVHLGTMEDGDILLLQAGE